MCEIPQLRFGIKSVLFLLTLLPYLALSQKSDSLERGPSFAVFPAISFAPETSWQFGAAVVGVLSSGATQDTTFVRQSTISPFFVYTLRNQILSAVNVNLFTSSGNAIDASVRYFNFPDLYFGIGNANDPDISEQYSHVFVQSEGRFLKPLNQTTFVGLGWDLQNSRITDVQEGGILRSENPLGIEGGTLLGLGPAFRYDSRNNAIYPSSGYLVSVNSLFTYVGDFSFNTHLIDARKYLSLWNEENIIALQISGSFTAGSVPFYKLPQLGGDNRLRGIANASLYRDRQMIYSQIEYRRPLFWRFGMVAFAGIGDVASRFGDFEFQDFKYVAGMGGRFAAIPEDKLNLRVDLGIARGGQLSFYVGISEAF